MAIKKAAGPAAFPVKLLKLILDDDDTALKHFHDTIVAVWNGGGVSQKCKDATIKNCTISTIRQSAAITGASPLWPMPAKCSSTSSPAA